MRQNDKLRTVTQEELNILLEKYGEYFNEIWDSDEDEEDDIETIDLDLSYTRLIGLDFSEREEFSQRIIAFGTFEGAYIENCTFKSVFAPKVNFDGAVVKNTSFFCGNFQESSFKGAKIKCCDFTGTDLYETDFTGCLIENLKWSKLTNLEGSQGFPDEIIPYVCPESGRFVAYMHALKKLEPNPRTGFDGCVVEIEVPEDAKRLSGTSKVCHCDKAKVLRILNPDGTEADITRAFCDHIGNARIGETIEVKDFWEDRWRYGVGIEFFMNFQDAM